jgi:hypothetical protein
MINKADRLILSRFFPTYLCTYALYFSDSFGHLTACSWMSNLLSFTKCWSMYFYFVHRVASVSAKNTAFLEQNAVLWKRPLLPGREYCPLKENAVPWKRKLFPGSDCSLSLWRVVRGSKLMHLDLIHGLFIT